MWVQRVVSVYVPHKLSCHMLGRLSPVFGGHKVLRVLEYLDPWLTFSQLLRQLVRAIGRPVVNNDQLPIFIGLGFDAVN